MTKKEVKTLSNAQLINIFSYNMCRDTKKSYNEQKMCLQELCKRGIITEQDIKEIFKEFTYDI